MPNIRKRILIVEDTESVARLYEVVLSPHFDVEIVLTRAEGLRRLTEIPKIDVIILDLFLPDKAGIDVLTEFQAAHKEIAIIVITGAGYDVSEIITKGAQEYLVKPVTNEQLLETVVRAIARHRVRMEFQPIRDNLKEAKEDLVNREARLTEAIKEVDGGEDDGADEF